jgi:hypothetical protein
MTDDKKQPLSGADLREKWKREDAERKFYDQRFCSHVDETEDQKTLASGHDTFSDDGKAPLSLEEVMMAAQRLMRGG